MRGPADNNVTVFQQQSGTLIFKQRIKRDHRRSTASPITATRYRCRNHLRAAELFGVRNHINGMQPLHQITVFVGRSYQINRVRARVDHRCSGDADLGHQIGAKSTGAERGSPRGNQTHLPIYRSTISINRIKTIVFRSDIEDVVRAAVDCDAGKIEGLSVHIAIDRHRKKLAELAAVDIRRG